MKVCEKLFPFAVSFAVNVPVRGTPGPRGPPSTPAVPSTSATGFQAARCSPALAENGSGVLAGLSVAFKLSNGPLALVLPVVWVLGPGGARAVATRIVIGGTATVLGFVIAYAPWGWQLWQQFGNPVYAWYDPLFDPLRALLGWRRP